MMIHVTHRTAAIAMALTLGAVLFVMPARLQAADPGQPAQASPPSGASAQKAPASPSDRVEAHIKSLHDRLKITAQQQSQWDAVAQVMRDNAAAISGLVRERRGKAANATAIDDLQAYSAIADAHAAGVKKLIPPFEALYATMSDAQKKNADTVFHHRPRPSSAKKGG